ncbi:MAG: prolipoprotein diacylglyceryl transferase [Planctomycetia bacterium]|nr:prolipoprotein diacylglyceryl transferase [Candidatus Brocadia sp.]QOJ05881.1 MAG: prolipoprotein diacylglyceryl transferase [Planctomycetia bacterium]TVL95317.1 MAG: prolipoprotein diacylglyceryl transferase [Candidatus Brocadia sp. BL1]HQU32364.1 prolipoprotein diacylglyceryl transferase [Candidatus Brocadia sapporoensis]
MANGLFVFVLAAFFIVLLRWSFKTLPGEGWQIVASVPVFKEESGRWRGVNLTYYGLLVASAYDVAGVILFILLGTLKIPLTGIFVMVLTLLLICVPASRFIAKIVEKKLYTFTIGGASFVGILIIPWALWLTNVTLGARSNFHIPLVPFLAAFVISYSFGETIGRLACISFGCCYGKPLSQSHPILRRIFDKYCFTFSGKTKKIAYESSLDGVKVIPIQAITSILYLITGIFSMLLFLQSRYIVAFILTVVVTQAWRAFSEIFRADYRGGRRISVYQIMAIISIVYSLGIGYFSPSASVTQTDVRIGLVSLWNPSVISFFFLLWVAIFLYTGRSTVTGSTLTFHVHRDRV